MEREWAADDTAQLTGRSSALRDTCQNVRQSLTPRQKESTVLLPSPNYMSKESRQHAMCRKKSIKRYFYFDIMFLVSHPVVHFQTYIWFIVMTALSHMELNGSWVLLDWAPCRLGTWQTSNNIKILIHGTRAYHGHKVDIGDAHAHLWFKIINQKERPFSANFLIFIFLFIYFYPGIQWSSPGMTNPKLHPKSLRISRNQHIYPCVYILLWKYWPCSSLIKLMPLPKMRRQKQGGLRGWSQRLARGVVTDPWGVLVPVTS